MKTDTKGRIIRCTSCPDKKIVIEGDNDMPLVVRCDVLGLGKGANSFCDERVS